VRTIYKTIFFAFALVLVCSVSSVRGQTSGGKARTVEFCEIVKTPERYLDKGIQFFATYSGGFMQHDLLSHPDCIKSVVIPSFDLDSSESPALRSKITARWMETENKTSSEEFVFTGYLKKDPRSGALPIDGLLQGYTMLLETAEAQRRQSVTASQASIEIKTVDVISHWSGKKRSTRKLVTTDVLRSPYPDRLDIFCEIGSSGRVEYSIQATMDWLVAPISNFDSKNLGTIEDEVSWTDEDPLRESLSRRLKRGEIKRVFVGSLDLRKEMKRFDMQNDKLWPYKIGLHVTVQERPNRPLLKRSIVLTILPPGWRD
jgi:hypothetical protein